MKRNFANVNLVGTLTLGAVFLVSSCGRIQSLCPPGIESERDARNKSYGSDRSSPVPLSLRAAILPLSYFPVSSEYCVEAHLNADMLAPDDVPESLTLGISGDKRQEYARAGAIEFNLSGTTQKLWAFVDRTDARKHALLIFGDLTNRKQTFGGGRYLDATWNASATFVLDFNRARNPDCAYGDKRLECPVIPRSNMLPVSVNAGERFATH